MPPPWNAPHPFIFNQPHITVLLLPGRINRPVGPANMHSRGHSSSLPRPSTSGRPAGPLSCVGGTPLRRQSQTAIRPTPSLALMTLLNISGSASLRHRVRPSCDSRCTASVKPSISAYIEERSGRFVPYRTARVL